jgi:antitoxin YefM
VNTITYSELRANFARTMDRVCNEHGGCVVTRKGKPALVLLSLDDYRSLEETAYLLSTTANATRLFLATAQLNLDNVQALTRTERG